MHKQRRGTFLYHTKIRIKHTHLKICMKCIDNITWPRGFQMPDYAIIFIGGWLYEFRPSKRTFL